MKEYRIDDLLFEEMILLDLEANNYEELIIKISDIAYEKGFVEENFSKGVIDREKIYPTGLPTNILKVAIPHAMERDNVKKSSIIVVKLDKPVQFKEMGSLEENYIPVDIVFLLAVSGSKDQLTILQELIGMFSDDKSMLRLKEATTQVDMMNALKANLSQNNI